MDTTKPSPLSAPIHAKAPVGGRVLDFTELQRLCMPRGPLPRVGTVRRWADRQGIRYRADGKGGIWTTLAALNAALGLVHGEHDESPVEDLI